ncbi:GNAT family N-acetyltransferase [Streptomyces durbertensis]|uniref:GNAT family N-acetyltransferase n=1 Tax=Streptomyces durbertensis TaxID=2448886 RepID=A0ABR6EBZ8_9ACTN|nr:GNAT family N-acetyltransferase [Streptomyces durbertensis]MBB1242856.1 GNAT family N-acetyltransferase [Streptomyces durbertensis]
MTTTLRPSAPERRFADGSRSRTYDICVNSRPVGGVRLRTEVEPGAPPVGRIDRLEVAPADRRRGRATVAVLAAEEILRTWDCSRAWLAVPATAEPAVSLAAALGYRPAVAHLDKHLTTAPELPPGTSHRPLTDEEVERWRADTAERFVAECVAEGMDREFAEARSRRDLAAPPPGGDVVATRVLWALEHRGERVGTLWLSPGSPGVEDGFVHSVAVDEPYRGRGHGRTLMLLAERECLAGGVDRLALNVFESNTVARRLYASLGYRATVLHYGKRLW